ncbi:MAG: DUF2854 domain-containing protein [Prochlorothrix sp.]|nr:DUF2854 domain-containing protein [Prochlorothrix sp.]
MPMRLTLSNLAVSVGAVLVVVGFWAYASGNATLNLAGFFYGFPVLLIGIALKAVELKPVPLSQPTPPEVLALRDKQATPTQIQVRKDISRNRYGQYVHLEPALKALKLFLSNEEHPELNGMREESRDGAYTLVLEFESPMIPFSKWQEKEDKMTRFFGPNIAIDLTQPKADWVEVALIAVPAEAAAE